MQGFLVRCHPVREIILGFLILLIIILVVVLAIVTLIIIQKLLNNNQSFAIIVGSLIGLAGVAWKITEDRRQAIKIRRQNQEKDSFNNPNKYYDGIIKLLENPGLYPIEKIKIFIEEFERRITIYASDNIIYQWTNLKEKFINAQINPEKIEKQDLAKFNNFIIAIRKEQGYKITPTNRASRYNKLVLLYENKKIARNL